MNRLILSITTIFIGILGNSQISIGSHTQLLNEKFQGVLFFDDNNGYAFGGNTLIMTHDGGNDWERYDIPIYSSENIKSLINTDKINDSTAIIVGGNGVILKTSDKGQNWNYKSLMFDGSENIFDVDFIDENIGFIIGKSENDEEILFYKTIDSGESWERITTNGISSGYNIYFWNEDIGFATSGYEFFKTIDGGINWSELENPSHELGSGMQTMKHIKILDANTVVASTYSNSVGSALFVSNDFGNTWDLFDDLYYTNDVSINGGNFDVYNDILYTYGWQNNEKKFIKYNLASQTIDTYSLYEDVGNIFNDIFVLNDDFFYIVDDGRDSQDLGGRKIVKGYNGGENWEQLDSFSYLFSSSDKRLNLLIDDGDYVASVYDGYDGTNYSSFYVHGSNDGGNSWKLKLKGDNKRGQLLHLKDNKIYAVTDDIYENGNNQMTFHFSNDFGNTWQTNNFFNSDDYGMPYQYFMLDENNLLFSSFGTIKYSNNQGNTWHTIPTPTFAGVDFGDNYYFKNLSEIYVWGVKGDWPGNYDYVLYKMSNLNDWDFVGDISDIDGSIYQTINAVTFFNDSNAIISVGGEKYFKINLTNGQDSELNFNHPIAGSEYLNENQLSFAEDDVWIMSGQYYYYYTSTNEGLSWIQHQCRICGDKMKFDESSKELIIYGNLYGIERIKEHNPHLEDVFGEYFPSINSIEEYFIPTDNFSNIEWELLSGGIIIEQTQKSSKIQWTETGAHILRINYSTEGRVETFDFEIIVGELSNSELTSEIKINAYPNPFESSLNFSIPESIISNNTITILLYNSLGEIIKSYNEIAVNKIVTLSNLENLTSGVYYFKLFINNNKYIIKTIKK